MRIHSLAAAALALAVAHAAQQAAPTQTAPSAASPGQDAQLIAQQLPSYPLQVCLVSDEPLESMGKPLDYVHEGRLVRFCCKSCVKEFKKDPAPILEQIDAAIIKAQQASYPLKTCVVSGNELGAEAVDHVHGTRLVRFCCPDCVAGFQKDAAKFMAKIDAALIAEQKKTYPLTTCVVSGKTIEGAGVDHLYGTRLVRFCCPECPAAFMKDPAKHLAQLDGAKKN